MIWVLDLFIFLDFFFVFKEIFLVLKGKDGDCLKLCVIIDWYIEVIDEW